MAPHRTLQPVDYFSSSPSPAHMQSSTRASRTAAMSGSMSSRGALQIPTKKPSGRGSFANRVPCNPETSVGLIAALVEPALVHLLVAEPVRCSARSITLAVMATDRCCMMTSSPFCVDDCSLLLCKLCDRCMNGRIIYMYMSMGFCTEACRSGYFLEYRYRLWQRTRIEARKAPVAEGEAAIIYRSIFFICAEVESVPEA